MASQTLFPATLPAARLRANRRTRRRTTKLSEDFRPSCAVFPPSRLTLIPQLPRVRAPLAAQAPRWKIDSHTQRTSSANGALLSGGTLYAPSNQQPQPAGQLAVPPHGRQHHHHIPISRLGALKPRARVLPICISSREMILRIPP